MYKLCWEGKIDVSMEFNLINTADKLLLLLMAAAIVRHFVITGRSNNTVIRWQRMEMWGHRRQSWKRRPQSKHKAALLIPGGCSPPPSHSSCLNWAPFHPDLSLPVQVLSCPYLMENLGPKALPCHGRQVPVTPELCHCCALVVALPGWHRHCWVMPGACARFPLPGLQFCLTPEQHPGILQHQEMLLPSCCLKLNILKLKHQIKDGWVLLNPRAKISIPGLKKGFTSTPFLAGRANVFSTSSFGCPSVT